MSYPTLFGPSRQLEAIRRQFAQADDLPFADVLPEQRILHALTEEGVSWREILWTPLLTLRALLAQMICPDGSCRAAVIRVMTWLLGDHEDPNSPDTSAYCKARSRLPESFLNRLALDVGSGLHEGVPEDWLWHGRRVKLVDGTTVSMPESPSNPQAYPTPRPGRGSGYPLARLVVVFCLATGAVVAARVGRYQGKKTGENALMRELNDTLGEGEVILADRYFAGYFDLALWQLRGCDFVVRAHQRRRIDWRRGRRLGRGDHVVTWVKPARPTWMDRETYLALPPTMEVREVRVRVRQDGFRTRELVVVSSLTDPEEFTAADLAELYRARWQAELDLRSLKSVLGMDVLRGKSPGMVRKEVWGKVLAYNLIRTVMTQSAFELGCPPRWLSFKGALQTLREFAALLQQSEGAEAAKVSEWVRVVIASQVLPERPDRVEPRAVKRRGKQYPLLNRPREEARNALLNNC